MHDEIKIINNLFSDWRYLATFRSSAPAKWKIYRNWHTTLGVGPQILMRVAPKVWTQFLKLLLYPTWAIKDAYRSNIRRRKKKKKLLL